MKKVSINLTTTSERLSMCEHAVYSMLRQTIAPDSINIWISKEPYLKDKGIPEIPSRLANLNDIKPIVNIKFVENIGPYRKLIAPVKEGNDDYILVTADDDIIYGENWLKELLACYEKNPSFIVAARMRAIKKTIFGVGRSSYLNWPLIYDDSIVDENYIVTFGGGVVISRDLVDEKFFKDENFLSIAPTTDDIWFTKILKKSNAKVVPCPKASKELFFISHEYGLENINIKKRSAGKLRNIVVKLLGGLGVSVSENDKCYRKIDKYFDSIYV